MNSAAMTGSFCSTLLALTAKGSGTKCAARLLDTLFFNGADQCHWFFTTKSGNIARKKDPKPNTNDIVDRLSMFALANPHNTEQFIGCLVDAQGRRRMLTKTSLQLVLEEMTSDDDGDAYQNMFLQVYLRPKQGRDDGYNFAANLQDDGRVAIHITHMTEFSNSKLEAESGKQDESVVQGIQATGETIFRAMVDANKFAVKSMNVHFVVDDNACVWVADIPHASFDTSVAVSSSSSIQFVRKAEDASNISPSSSSLPRIPSSQGQRENANASAESDGVAAIHNPKNSYNASRGSTAESDRGEDLRGQMASDLDGLRKDFFIATGSAFGKEKGFLYREGGTIKCDKGPSDLPGLKGWVAASIGDEGEPIWTVDLDEYSRKDLSSPSKTNEDIRAKRAKMKVVEKAQLVAAAIRAERLLQGELQVSSDGEFMRLWSQTIASRDDDESLSKIDREIERMKDDDGEVLVCGNTQAICSKIESIASALGLREKLMKHSRNAKKPQSASKLEFQRPKTETPLTSSVSADNISATSHNVHTAGPEVRGRRNSKIQAPLAFGEQDFTKDLQPQSQDHSQASKGRPSSRDTKKKSTSISPTNKASPRRVAIEDRERMEDPMERSTESLENSNDSAPKEKGMRHSPKRSEEYNKRMKATADVYSAPIVPKMPKKGEKHITGGGGSSKVKSDAPTDSSSQIHDDRIDVEANMKIPTEMRKTGVLKSGKYSSVDKEQSSRKSMHMNSKPVRSKSLSSTTHDSHYDSTNDSLTDQGVQGSRRKKKTKSNLPGRGVSEKILQQRSALDITEEEVRLAELERLASQHSRAVKDHREFQHQFAMQNAASMNMIHASNAGFVSHVPTSTSQSTVSKIEANFMARQVMSGSMAMDDPTLGIGEAGLKDSVYADPSTSKDRYHVEQMHGALSSRVKELETQVESLQGVIERKEDERDQVEDRLKRVVSELENTRASYKKQFAVQNEEHTKELLRLKEQHSKEMAFLATVGQEQKPKTPNVLRSPPQPPVNGPGEANKALIEQLEILRNDHKKLKEEHADERRVITVEANTKLMQMERSMKSDILSLRARNTELEDIVSSRNDELATAYSKIDVLTQNYQQLEVAKDKQYDELYLARKDLKNMQQSVSASYRLEAAQGLATGVDPDTQIKLSEAKSDAKVRQLTNKMEFLKSELDAEKASSEDARNALENMRVRIEQMQDDFRSRLQQADNTKKIAVEEAERNMTAIYEERMLEMTALQSRLATIQGQLMEVTQENSVATQREEALKASTLRAQAHVTSMKVEIESLQQQLVELREFRDNSAAKDLEKHNHDAVIRRLDNERQYLKNQVASEITLKNELQTALTMCQQQVVDLKNQWKEDVENLKDQHNNQRHKAATTENHLKQTITNLEADATRQQAQNKDLKEGFLKMRDQVRIEQLTIENMSAANKQLQEQLTNQKEEIARLSEYDTRDGAMSQNQIAALRATVIEQEDRRLKEANKLKEELAKQYNLVSHLQAAALDIHGTFDKERRKITVTHAAEKVTKALHHWRHNRLAIGFRTWLTKATLVGAATQFRTHVSDLVQNTLIEQRGVKQEALSKQEDTLKKEHDQKVEELHAQFNELARVAKEAAELEKSDLANALREEHQTALAMREAQVAQERSEVLKEHMDSLEKALDAKDKKMEELQQKEEDLRDELTDAMNLKVVEASKKSAEDAKIYWENVLKDREAEIGNEIEEAVARARDELEIGFQQTEKEFETKLKDQVKASEEKLAWALEEADDKHEDRVRALKDDQEKYVASLRQELQDAMLKFAADKETQIRAEVTKESDEKVAAMRSEWKFELDGILAEKDAVMREDVDKRMMEYKQSVEDERVSGLKLEASKWRQTLKDSEKRYAMELETVRMQMQNEADLILKNEMEKVANNFKLDIQRTLDEAAEERKRVEFDYEAKLEEIKNSQNDEKDDAIDKAVVAAKAEVHAEWEVKSKEITNQAIQEFNVVWEEKMTVEKGRLDAFRRDVQVQIKNLADERVAVEEKLTATERDLEDLKYSKEKDIRKVTKELQTQLDEFQIRVRKEKKEALNELSKQHDTSLQELESSHALQLAARISDEKRDAAEQLAAELEKLRKEKDEIITEQDRIEGTLKEEIQKRNVDIGELHQKVEELQDNIFDQEQLMKSVKKANSITTWQMCTKYMQMDKRYKEELQQLKLESSFNLREVEEAMTTTATDAALTAMRICTLVQDLEYTRKKAHDVLLNYKTDLLAEKRSEIRELEKEIAQAADDKDATDDERDNVELEIDALENEVRDLEEQIREHNRSSSMQNGRINVAHQRKKRRLDADLERMFELIEQKRMEMTRLEKESAEKGKERDKLEASMIDLEKELVQILVEQMKVVLGHLDAGKGLDEKLQEYASDFGLPWPPYRHPQHKDVPPLTDVKKIPPLVYDKYA